MAKHLHSVQVSGFINEKETEIKKEGKREREADSRQTERELDRQRKRQTEIERQTGFNRETDRF